MTKARSFWKIYKLRTSSRSRRIIDHIASDSKHSDLILPDREGTNFHAIATTSNRSHKLDVANAQRRQANCAGKIHKETDDEDHSTSVKKRKDVPKPFPQRKITAIENRSPLSRRDRHRSRKRTDSAKCFGTSWGSSTNVLKTQNNTGRDRAEIVYPSHRTAYRRPTIPSVTPRLYDDSDRPDRRVCLRSKTLCFSISTFQTFPPSRFRYSRSRLAGTRSRRETGRPDFRSRGISLAGNDFG